MVDLGIVIVSYNTRDLLRTCLETVYASQGDFSFKVCVVDNNSPDGSAALVSNQFPDVHLIANEDNPGYPAANNQGLQAFGYPNGKETPRFALLLNPDTELPPDGLARMLDFLVTHSDTGAAGPRLILPDGSLDLACRRSFPSPEVSLYRLSGLSKLFPRSRRFGRYNMTYLDEHVMTEVDAVVGAFMLIRGEAIRQVGLMDDTFFMYGEDLDWCYRIKDAGWKIVYNPEVTVIHVKRAASKHSARAQVEFWRAMSLFYDKHYAEQTSWPIHALITTTLRLRTKLEELRQGVQAGGASE
jgi:GT2 family glycosyltransferase